MDNSKYIGYTSIRTKTIRATREAGRTGTTTTGHRPGGITMKKITYQTNRQLWTLQNSLESAGYSKTADCYWSQIYTSANGDEIALDRDEDTTNDPAADLAEMLAPSTAEEPAEAIQSIMSRLTALKAESIAEADPFGQSPADREIKAIAATLAVFGVHWYYTKDSAGKWVAVLK